MFKSVIALPLIALIALGQEASPPDPKCLNGILEESDLVCCAKECGTCGGPNCGASPGGGANCCTGSIRASNISCLDQGAPCNLPRRPPMPTECGEYPQPLSTTQPNVMMIGDSISMSPPYTPGGYGVFSRQMLEAKNISVWHSGGFQNGGQASNTVKGLMCTNSSTAGNWLNFTGTYDVIHFNFGLHDLVDPGPGEGQEHVDIPQYGKNLAEIYRRLQTKAKKVIWTTTTPCPNVTTSMGRTDAKVIAYNDEAHEALMATFGDTVLVDDLYTAVDTYCGENYKTCDLQLPANVHFTPKGCQFMANVVVTSILKALGTEN